MLLIYFELKSLVACYYEGLGKATDYAIMTDRLYVRGGGEGKGGERMVGSNF